MLASLAVARWGGGSARTPRWSGDRAASQVGLESHPLPAHGIGLRQGGAAFSDGASRHLGRSGPFHGEDTRSLRTCSDGACATRARRDVSQRARRRGPGLGRGHYPGDGRCAAPRCGRARVRVAGARAARLGDARRQPWRRGGPCLYGTFTRAQVVFTGASRSIGHDGAVRRGPMLREPRQMRDRDGHGRRGAAATNERPGLRQGDQPRARRCFSASTAARSTLSARSTAACSSRLIRSATHRAR